MLSSSRRKEGGGSQKGQDRLTFAHNTKLEIAYWGDKRKKDPIAIVSGNKPDRSLSKKINATSGPEKKKSVNVSPLSGGTTIEEKRLIGGAEGADLLTARGQGKKL